jgi:LacI family transcriptional regulator, galactose operon repressor
MTDPPARPEAPRRRGVTIVDVARHAGVGVGTVSRVLNDRKNVSEATVARVLEAIAATDYHPSRTARNLSLGRTHTIAVIIPFITSPSVAERLRGLLDRLSESDYEIALYDVGLPERRSRSLARLTRPGFADAAIVTSHVPSDDLIDGFGAAGTHVVLLDASHPRLPHVAINDVRGGRLAVEHLVELGHRRIAFIGDDARPEGFTSIADRREGYLQTLAAAGIQPLPELQEYGAIERDEAHRIAGRMLSLAERPTAVFAAYDTLALGVLEAARLAGVDVPGELSVIGFDDLEVASYAGLTTVRQPLRESGRVAAEILLDVLAGREGAARQVELPLNIVVRRTTGRVR